MPTYEWHVIPQTHNPENLGILKILVQTVDKNFTHPVTRFNLRIRWKCATILINDGHKRNPIFTIRTLS